MPQISTWELHISWKLAYILDNELLQNDYDIPSNKQLKCTYSCTQKKNNQE